MRAGVQEDAGFTPLDGGCWDTRASEPEMHKVDLLQVTLPPYTHTSLSPSGWEKGTPTERPLGRLAAAASINPETDPWPRWTPQAAP